MHRTYLHIIPVVKNYISKNNILKSQLMVTLIVFFVVFVEKFFEFLKKLTNDTVIKIGVLEIIAEL